MDSDTCRAAGRVCAIKREWTCELCDVWTFNRLQEAVLSAPCLWKTSRRVPLNQVYVMLTSGVRVATAQLGALRKASHRTIKWGPGYALEATAHTGGMKRMNER